MQNALTLLREKIIGLARRPDFIHHKWFVEHHLDIVAQLANELCGRHPVADRDIVMAMVWLHDLGKILSSKTLPRQEEDELTFLEGEKILHELGFSMVFTKAIIENLRLFEQATKRDLSCENIEVRIASTADGCAHFIGPFFSLYWYENPELGIDHLFASQVQKAMKDARHKIVLPEAQAAFQNRIQSVLECDPSNRKISYYGD